jgi:hypothetical protein
VKKQFHIGDVLSITTGYLVAPGHAGARYQILEFMTGDELMSHQLGQAQETCAAWLLCQFPQLRDAAQSAPAGSRDENDWFAWRDAQEQAHGTWFDVEDLPAGVWASRDRLIELVELVVADRIIPVAPPGS